MKARELIEHKLNDLIKLMMTVGVQPSELADNVFLKDYKSIKFYKQGNLIVGEIIFEEMVADAVTDVTMKYYYNSSKKVIQIVEEYCDQYTVLWDRETKETEIINEIVHLITKLDPNKVEGFINSLPSNFKEEIRKKAQVVA